MSMSLKWLKETGDTTTNILVDSMNQQLAEVFEVDREQEVHYNILDHFYGVEYGEDAEEHAMQRVLDYLGIRVQL
jgi:hypothetical protein